MIKKLLLTTFLMLAMANTAHSEMTVEQYEQGIAGTESQKTTVTILVNGMGIGIGWANFKVEDQHGKGLFCLPENLALQYQNFLDILDRQIKYMRENSPSLELATLPIGVFLMDGLIRTFPCE